MTIAITPSISPSLEGFMHGVVGHRLNIALPSLLVMTTDTQLNPWIFMIVHPVAMDFNYVL